MKNYSAKAIVAIAISVVLFTSCKKDVPGFEKTQTNTAINNVPTTNNADIMQVAKKPGTGGGGGGILWPDTTKLR